MLEFTFEEIKASLLKCINEYGCEAELSLSGVWQEISIAAIKESANRLTINYNN